MNYIYMLMIIVGCTINSRPMWAMDSADMQEVKTTKKDASFLKDFLNGAIAGGLEVACNNPLVVLKNDLILSKGGSEKNMLAMLVEYAKDPKKMLKKYYKGCGTGIASMAPITALQNGIAVMLGGIFGDDPTLAQRTLAACGGGAMSAILGSPSDLVVLQRQNPLYTNETLMATVRRICAHNGLATLYRGVAGTATRDGIFTAAYKTGGEALSAVMPSLTGNPSIDKIVCASLAGVIAAIISHPDDVITARMKSDLAREQYQNSIQTAMSIVSEESVAALFKGLTPRAFRIMIAIPFISAVLQLQPGSRAVESLVAKE